MALVFAASTRDWDEVLRLLDLGREKITQTDRSSGMTCLMWTCQWGNYKIAQKLLETVGIDAICEPLSFKDEVINGRNRHGVTPLMFAADGNAPDIVKLLLENLANAETLSLHGMSALLLASRSGAAKTVKVLLEGNANINVKGAGGLTALMHAAGEDQTDVVEVLLQHGPAMDLQDRDGQTALIYATRKNATIRPRHNFAPMVDYIKKCSHVPSVMDMLLEAQADLELRDKEGKRALDHAGAKSYHLLQRYQNELEWKRYEKMEEERAQTAQTAG